MSPLRKQGKSRPVGSMPDRLAKDLVFLRGQVGQTHGTEETFGTLERGRRKLRKSGIRPLPTAPLQAIWRLVRRPAS